MLVAVIFIVILSSVVALSGDKTPREDLQAQSQAAVDIISRAHNYAVTGYWGDNWGVKVLNASADCVDSGTGDCIIIYRGRLTLAGIAVMMKSLGLLQAALTWKRIMNFILKKLPVGWLPLLPVFFQIRRLLSKIILIHKKQ